MCALMHYCLDLYINEWWTYSIFNHITSQLVHPCRHFVHSFATVAGVFGQIQASSGGLHDPCDQAISITHHCDKSCETPGSCETSYQKKEAVFCQMAWASAVVVALVGVAHWGRWRGPLPLSHWRLRPVVGAVGPCRCWAQKTLEIAMICGLEKGWERRQNGHPTLRASLQLLGGKQPNNLRQFDFKININHSDFSRNSCRMVQYSGPNHWMLHPILEDDWLVPHCGKHWQTMDVMSSEQRILHLIAFDFSSPILYW